MYSSKVCESAAGEDLGAADHSHSHRPSWKSVLFSGACVFVGAEVLNCLNLQAVHPDQTPALWALFVSFFVPDPDVGLSRE